MIMKIIRKRKAVSPVIAVILLIGLTVLAGAVVAFIVLPMLNPPFSASKVDMEVYTDASYSAALSKTTITLNIANGNSMDIEIIGASALNVTAFDSTVISEDITAGSASIVTFTFDYNVEDMTVITVTFIVDETEYEVALTI